MAACREVFLDSDPRHSFNTASKFSPRHSFNTSSKFSIQCALLFCIMCYEIGDDTAAYKAALVFHAPSAPSPLCAFAPLRLRPFTPSEKLYAQFGSNKQHAGEGGIHKRTVAKVWTNTLSPGTICSSIEVPAWSQQVSRIGTRTGQNVYVKMAYKLILEGGQED